MTAGKTPQPILAVDFDGTIVDHRYPDMGQLVPHAIPILKHLSEQGFKLILWTVRNNAELREAVGLLEANEIPLWGVNENPTQKFWASGPKAYAPYYIDDAAIGCPLIYPQSFARPCVDWLEVFNSLMDLYPCLEDVELSLHGIDVPRETL